MNNGFQEIVNVTSVGSWLAIDDFVDLIKVIFSKTDIDSRCMIDNNMPYVLNEMMNLDFIELDEFGTLVRVKKEWYK